jgi:heavy metal sensor kinase
MSHAATPSSKTPGAPRGGWKRLLGGGSIAGAMQRWHAGLLGLVLLGFGVATYAGVRRMTYQRLDADLERAVQALAAGIHPAPPPDRDMHSPYDNGPPDDGPSPRGHREGGFDGWRNGGRGDHPPDDGPDATQPWDEARGGHRGRPGDFGPWRGGPAFVDVDLPEGFAARTGSPEEGGRYYVVWRGDGTILRKSMAADTASLGLVDPGWRGADPPRGPRIPAEPILRERSAGANTFHEALLYGPFGTRMIVGKSVAPEQAALRRTLLLLVVTGAGVMAAGLAGGWLLSRRVVRPIQRMTAVAGDISATNLSRRMDVSALPGELEELAGVLNEMFGRLDEAFAQQVRFTADASHELRTPLAVIHTQLQLALSRARSAEEYQKTLATCLRASGRMKGLVDSLLLLAGADAGRLSLERESFDLRDVVEDCAAMVATVASEKGVSLTTDLQPAIVQGDAARVGQVVTNLLANAIRYNRPPPDGGRVQILLRTAGGEALLSVEDSGVGIPPEHLPHVFERFYRVDPARSREAGGNGLGLAICKSIAEAHGGRIEVASTPHVGTTFTLRLPLAPAARPDGGPV